MNPWRRFRERSRAVDQPTSAEAAARPDDDVPGRARQAVSPERFDRPLLQLLDPA